jgi:hypothetical protein
LDPHRGGPTLPGRRSIEPAGCLTLSEDDRRVLAAWAADCVKWMLWLFEARTPNDTGPRDAIDGRRAFAGGELRRERQ